MKRSCTAAGTARSRRLGLQRWLLAAAFPWLMACTAAAREAPPAVDASARLDAARPPDLALSDSTLAGAVGGPCGGDAGACPRNAVCLRLLGADGGVCGLPGCAREDLSTARREDNCPPQTTCTTLERALFTPATTACLPSCSPTSGSRCALAAASCDPLSVLRTGTTPVCLTGRCSVDADCGDRDPATADVRCDADAGVCRNIGRSAVPIGARCSKDSECGAGQHCLQRWWSSLTAETTVPGGYCTVVGCRSGGSWSCPAGSACFGLGPGGSGLSACLALGCDPAANAAQDGCRDDPPGQPYLCFPVGALRACWIDPAAARAL